MTWRMLAVAACCRSASSNSRVFAASCSASVAADAFRPAQFLSLAVPVWVRAPRLEPFAFDSPRRICRRPIDSVGRNANLAHLFATAHRSQCDLRHTLQDSLNPIRRVFTARILTRLRASIAGSIGQEIAVDWQA